MNRKRILSFIMVMVMVMVMVFAMAATACGKKEEAAEKEEPKQEEVSDADEEDVSDDEEEADAADKEADTSKVKKTGDDILTEEDIESLKGSIRDTVISEYLEPNNISVEDFVWPDKDSGEWGYMVDLLRKYDLEFALGEEVDMDILNTDSSSYSNPELIEAAFNGIIYWLDKQGKYDDLYLGNVYSAVSPYNEVIPTIDITSK